ncbi:unnamed protein product [Paramecium octaurelia]|uniref:Uncharacterized protein n=1 Tax=Paramecium octaurelia TaxID=43137 RepID=A0A8S1X4N6_PAROT|nr:unnamed protein product [Paramecium octaurelia]
MSAYLLIETDLVKFQDTPKPFQKNNYQISLLSYKQQISLYLVGSLTDNTRNNKKKGD